jgi:hypothetical protein
LKFENLQDPLVNASFRPLAARVNAALSRRRAHITSPTASSPIACHPVETSMRLPTRSLPALTPHHENGSDVLLSISFPLVEPLSCSLCQSRATSEVLLVLRPTPIQWRRRSLITFLSSLSRCRVGRAAADAAPGATAIAATPVR